MTDSTVLAIDVAFLLPEPLKRLVIAFNERMLPPPDGLRFDATHLPHLTLVQQFVRRTALDQIHRVVTEAVSGLDAPTLMTTNVRVGRVAGTLGVARTAELFALHRHLLDVLAPFQTTTAGPGAFFADGDIARSTDIEWVGSFRQRSALTSFDPHITLGVGRMETTVTPSRCLATELALFHLGRFCTCGRALNRWTLTDPNR